MIGIIILLAILILVSAIGFIIIYQKLDKKPDIKIPDVNVMVKMDSPNIKTTQFKDSEKNPDWYVDPVNYIERTKTKAHIRWDDMDSHGHGSSNT